MIGLLQRVSEASVTVDGECVGKIGPGLMVLLCAERGDTRREADALLAKLLSYRVFYDGEGKMNLNVAQVGGGLLLVPQFTLASDTRCNRAIMRIRSRCHASLMPRAHQDSVTRANLRLPT